MAQRDRRPPPRIGAGLLTFGTRLPGGFPQPEKARPRPMRAGDPPRDLGQGAVALAVILKAIIEYDDPMRAPAPLAKQSCAGFEQQSRREGAGSIRLQFFGHPAQPALYGGSGRAPGARPPPFWVSRRKKERPAGGRAPPPPPTPPPPPPP